MRKAIGYSDGFFFISKLFLFTHHKAMTLKVVITYYAHPEDWEIQDVLDGRKVSEVQDELKQMLSEDVQYIWENSDISITESKDSI